MLFRALPGAGPHRVECLPAVDEGLSVSRLVTDTQGHVWVYRDTSPAVATCKGCGWTREYRHDLGRDVWISPDGRTTHFHDPRFIPPCSAGVWD